MILAGALSRFSCRSTLNVKEPPYFLSIQRQRGGEGKRKDECCRLIIFCVCSCVCVCLFLFFFIELKKEGIFEVQQRPGCRSLSKAWSTLLVAIAPRYTEPTPPTLETALSKPFLENLNHRTLPILKASQMERDFPFAFSFPPILPL